MSTQKHPSTPDAFLDEIPGAGSFFLQLASAYHTQFVIMCLEGMLHNITNMVTALSCSIEDSSPYLPPTQRHHLIRSYQHLATNLEHSRALFQTTPALTPEVFSADVVVNRAITLMQPLAHRSALKLLTRVSQTPTQENDFLVAGTTVTLEQVVINLLLNAIEHLSIFSKTLQPKIWIQLQSESSHVVISIVNQYESLVLHEQQQSHPTRRGIGLEFVRYQVQELLAGQFHHTKTHRHWHCTVTLPRINQQ